MSLALDASTPALVSTAAAQTITTASFSPPSASLLIANMVADENGGNTITADPVITSSPALIWTKIGVVDSRTALNGVAAVWYAISWISQAYTVTVTTPTGDAANGISNRVSVITGANLSNPIGAKGTGNNSGSVITSTYSSNFNGSWGWLNNSDNGSSTVPTPTAGETTDVSNVNTGHYTQWLVKQTNTTTVSGTSVTMADNAAVSGSVNNWIYYEILPKITPMNRGLRPHPFSPGLAR
jgi:hypothetical protein